jgi:hypothetical protein
MARLFISAFVLGRCVQRDRFAGAGKLIPSESGARKTLNRLSGKIPHGLAVILRAGSTTT